MFNFNPSFMNTRNYAQQATLLNTQGPSKVAPMYTVTSLQEVQMAQPNYDGTPTYFYLQNEGVIVAKIMDLSGLVKLRYFKEEIIPVDNTVTNSIAKETTADGDISSQIDARIAPILAELATIKEFFTTVKTQMEDKNDERTKSNANSGNVEERNSKSDTTSKSVF